MIDAQQNLNLVVERFVADFNRMCEETGRNYLLQPKNSKHESSKNPTRYRVTYRARQTASGWKIYAERRFLLFFKKKYPLLDINFAGPHKIAFDGLFVAETKVINRNPAELQAALGNYLNYCRLLPLEAFINV
jgi:hypothetical protein